MKIDIYMKILYVISFPRVENVIINYKFQFINAWFGLAGSKTILVNLMGINED